MTGPDVARAVGLRVAGIPFPVVAEQCGFESAEAARLAVHEALTLAAGFDPSTEVITGLARLDRLFAAVWRDAIGGDEGKARLAVKIMDQRFELLRLSGEIGMPGKGRVTPLDELNARRAEAGRGAITSYSGRATVADHRG